MFAKLSGAAAQLPFFNVGVHNSPHFEKRYKGGEDAFITKQRLVAVADGVGGWASKDICSGICAKFLCKRIGSLFDADNDKTLMELLQDGVKGLREADILGCTTVVMAKLEPDV